MLTHNIYIVTPKGKQAIKDYREGIYWKANISELQYAFLLYAQHLGALRTYDSLKRYGTEGTTAIEDLISMEYLKPHEGETVITEP